MRDAEIDERKVMNTTNNVGKKCQKEEKKVKLRCKRSEVWMNHNSER